MINYSELNPPSLVQLIVTFGSIMIVSMALPIIGLIPYLGVIFDIANWILRLLAFVLWIVLMVKAIQGTKYKLHWAGDFAEKRSG